MMTKKLKILAAGDLHGDIKAIEDLAKRAKKEEVDLVVLTGDLTFHEQSTENIIGPFVKRGEKVLLIPGNHETLATADFLAELYNVQNLHGYSIKSGEVGFFGCGGANVGPKFLLNEKEIYETLKKAYSGLKDIKKKIMITHVHPSDSTMEKFSEFIPGSKGVLKALKQFKPDLLLCSHVHEAEGIEEKIGNTKIVNVGKKGKIIEL